MERVTERLRTIEIDSGKDRYILTLNSEDFSALYPGMVRYTVTVTDRIRTISVFRTNSFEYSPCVPLDAATVAQRTADKWEDEIRQNPSDFVMNQQQVFLQRPVSLPGDLVVIQGSPRADGNCSILADWAVEAAQELGKQAQVIYPHDMDIHCCIGCYQCYNTGSCVFDDDMGSIIDAVRNSALLVVCAPVYTNTVPGGLKLVIDRCQAYHAERILFGGTSGQRGLVFSVAGRKGKENFTCITRVVSAFLRNLDITPVGEILIDHVDAIRDIRTIPGLKNHVRETVQGKLLRKKPQE